jgi:hypothetical protein
VGVVVRALDFGMSTPLCEKCGRRNLVTYQVEPKAAWAAVVRIRWKSICPSCFDAEAERAGEQAALTLCQIQALSLE